MKSTEELQQDYEKYLDLIKRKETELLKSALDEKSTEELEQLIEFAWEQDNKEDNYDNGYLCGMLSNYRKEKLNSQFVFNKENIEKIVRVDKQLKECCKQLKKETENLFNYMLGQKRESFTIFGNINISAGTEFLDCALSVLNEHLLGFSLCQDEDINMRSIFNFDRNYADKVLSYNTQRMTSAYNASEDYHIGFAFYEIYQKGCLSLQDITENIEIYSNIKLEFCIK